MTPPLQILLVEDAPLDAELTLGTLSEGGVRFDAVRVETEEQYRRELLRPEISPLSATVARAVTTTRPARSQGA